MRPNLPFLSAASNALTEVMKIARLTSPLLDAPRLSSPRPRRRHGRRLALVFRLNLTLNLYTLKYLVTLFQLRTNGKYIYGWVILKTERERETKANRRQNKEEKKRKGEELDGTTRRKGDYRLLQCGVGDCLHAKAYILIELCCKRVGWQPSFSSVSP